MIWWLRVVILSDADLPGSSSDASCIAMSLFIQGALFRVYPGGYQCMLDTGNGRYRRVETLKERPALSTFKETITQALDVDDNKAMASMRRGAFQKTWWEKENNFEKEASNNWRT